VKVILDIASAQNRCHLLSFYYSLLARTEVPPRKLTYQVPLVLLNGSSQYQYK